MDNLKKNIKDVEYTTINNTFSNILNPLPHHDRKKANV